MRDFWNSRNHEHLPPPITKVHSRPNFLNMDNDTALILTLIMLLKNEGADSLLLMALLYILF